jgi:urea transport system permease protein
MSLLTQTSPLWRALLTLGVFLLSVPWVVGQEALPLASLQGFDFKAKTAAITAIADSGSPRASVILPALLDGRLLERESDHRMIIADGTGDNILIVDALDGSALGNETQSNLKKVVINNQLRLVLRGALARLGLANPDRAARLAAVESLAADASPGTITALHEALPKEKDASVARAIHVVLALSDFSNSDPAKRLAAVQTVSGSMLSEVRNRLASLVAKDQAGQPLEPAMDVRVAAGSAIRAIDSRRAHYELIQTIFFGLSLGFVLVLAATGLAITFGVMGVINMAHGEMMMLGAYTTYVVQQAFPNHIEQSLFIAIPAAFLVAGAVGIVIERGIVRFLYGRPLETLLATFGVSLFLQQLVRSVFSPLNRAVATPQWMSGQLMVGDALALTWNRLYIILFSALVFAALLALLRYTSLGLHVRAVAQNRAMARAMGVRAGWVDALTFGLGSGVAGLAGVALSQLTNVGPNLGQSYIIDSFMVVVFGGVGSLWGTLVAGLSLGIANKFLEPFAGAVLAKILVLVFIILFIQKWPRGLFPQRGRSAEA